MLARELCSHGVELNVVDLPSRKPTAVFALLRRFPATTLFLTHDWLMIPYLMSLNKRWHGNHYIVISNGVLWDTWASVHWPSCRMAVYNAMLSSVVKHARAVVCNSEYLRRGFEAKLPEFKSKMCTIYNGIDVQNQRLCVPFSFPVNSINFVVPTNFEYPLKYAGLWTILDALETATLREFNVHILGKTLTGQGEQNLAEFREKVTRKYERLKIHLHSNANVYSFFQPEQAILLYSSGVGGDSLPRVLLEAQAVGMPMIVSDTGGCAEAVAPNKSAILVEPTVIAMQRGIAHVLSQDFDRHAMRKAGFMNIRQRFGWDVMAEQYAHLMYSVF